MTTSPAAAPRSSRGRLARRLALILLVFTLVPLSIMSVAAYVRNRALLFEALATEIESQTAAQVVKIQTLLRNNNDNLAFLGTNQGFFAQLNAIQPLDPNADLEYPEVREAMMSQFRLTNSVLGARSFEEFIYLKPNGLITASSVQEWEGVSLANSAYMDIIRGSSDRSIIVYDLDPLYSDQVIMLVVEPLNLPSNPGGGFLIGIIRGERLTADVLAPMASLYPSGRAYFVTSDGTLLGPNSDNTGLVRLDPNTQQQTRIIAGLDLRKAGTLAGPLEFTNDLNEPVIANVQWVASMNAGLLTEVPISVFSDQIFSLIPFTFGLAIFSIVAAALAVWFISIWLVRPIVQLTQVTQRMAEGDLGQRLPTGRDDELGQLAISFNAMADELSAAYHSMENQIEERTDQIRIASEIAQNLTTTTNLDDLLNKTVSLLLDRFDYYHTAIYLVDRSGKNAILRAAYSPAADQMLARGYRLEVGSQSIVGWVAANNQARVTANVAEDPMHLRYELLPDTQSEAGIPISAGGMTLGVLDVQSASPNAFDSETVIVLQTLANQLAAAIQNVMLAGSTQVNVQEIERLYRASQIVARAQSRRQVLDNLAQVMREAPYVTAVYAVENNGFSLIVPPGGARQETQPAASQRLEILPDRMVQDLSLLPAIMDPIQVAKLPPDMARNVRQLGCQTITMLPVQEQDKLVGLVLIGTRQRNGLTSVDTQPYASLADLANTTLEKLLAARKTEQSLAEMQALAAIGQTISAVDDLPTLYAALHEQVRQTIGDFDFSLALYDAESHSISVPYFFEQGHLSRINAFPMGEGLTSILIRTRQPLMLLEETEKKALALGAKVVGGVPLSWMGVPMLVGGEPIGAIILQDLENERAFTEDDQRFVTALAGQAAGAIYNVRLLEEARQRSLQLQTASEIARDVSGSLNLDELLSKAVTLIRDRFAFYHASIFLIDATGEHALIREATGEAGAQMKRMGHKLAVGSKSIVGYVSARGESLVVNDTANDATYYANPLLPDTRAEAGLPIKLGDRILGVMDVQSTQAFAFGEEAMRTLSILADQLAVAIVNTELFAETQEHLSQHRLLHHITTSAASGTTLEEASKARCRACR